MEEKQTEVKQVGEKEFLIGKTRMYLDEDNKINVLVEGVTDGMMAIAYKDTLFKLAETSGGEIRALIDLNKSGKVTLDARTVAQEVFKNNKNIKLAFFGLHPVARMIAFFIIGVIQKKNIRFFKTKEDALAWLKE